MSEIIFHTTKLLYHTFQKNDDFLGEFRVDNIIYFKYPKYISKILENIVEKEYNGLGILL